VPVSRGAAPPPPSPPIATNADRVVLGCERVVPLCYARTATPEARRLRRDLRRIVTWWTTPIEVRTALARLSREGEMTPAERTAAIRRLGQLRSAWNEIVPSERVRSLAEDLPDAHELRAGDAAQLAAALVWCRGAPKQRPFVCLDERLRAAAAAIGFAVVPE